MQASRVVVMGVSGCGKSTVGEALAAALHWRYSEGDRLHPAENVARMAAGTPLTDADRAGWLAKIAAELSAAAARGEGLVVTCSSLKRSYRDVLRTGDPALRFIFLHGPRQLLEARLQERRGHYMPPSLLQSQLEALEPPGDDEFAQPLSITAAPQQLAESAHHWIATHPAAP